MPHRVLVMDDSEYARVHLRNMLQAHGFEVVGEAKDVSEAIEFYKRLKPDLVTADIVMPEASGLEAIKGLQDLDSKAKIIVVTVLEDEASIEQARELGIVAFVRKPVEWPELEQAITKVLQR